MTLYGEPGCPFEADHVAVVLHIDGRLRHPSWNGSLRALPEPNAWHSIGWNIGWHRHFDDCDCFVELVRR